MGSGFRTLGRSCCSWGVVCELACCVVFLDEACVLDVLEVFLPPAFTEAAGPIPKNPRIRFQRESFGAGLVVRDRIVLPLELPLREELLLRELLDRGERLELPERLEERLEPLRLLEEEEEPLRREELRPLPPRESRLWDWVELLMVCIYLSIFS